MRDSHVEQAWMALRVTYGLVAFLAGMDKFFNLLTNWQAYLSPAVANLLPVTGSTAMHVAGIVEMAVGILILTRWTRVGAYLASAWLLFWARTRAVGEPRPVVAAMVSMNDLADRPPRPLADGQEIVIGKKRLRWLDAPHVPHNWECGYMFEPTTRTLR